jgi:hypothetical protein
MPEANRNIPFVAIPSFAIPTSWRKVLFEASTVRKWVYTLERPKAEDLVPAMGGGKRCLAMGVASQL